MDFKDIETRRLKRLLRDVAAINAAPVCHFKLDRYDVSVGLKALDGRPGVAADEMAQLEFLLIDALDHSKYGFPNLESQIAQTPAIFVQAAAFALWLAEVQRSCHEYATADIGDHWLGQLLTKAPAGENGVWPCEAVCEAMEAIVSREIGRGLALLTRVVLTIAAKTAHKSASLP